MTGRDEAPVDPTTADGLAPSLREQTVAGVRAMGLTRIIAELAALGSSVILARLVPPAEFGRTTVAIFVGALALAVQQGVGSSLVAHRAPSEHHFQAACLVALVAGVVGTLATLMFSLTLAPLIFGDRIASFAALASPTWLLATLAAVPIARLQRGLNFGRLGVVEASASVVSPTVAIVLALAGLGGKAIVVGGLTAVGVTAALAFVFSSPSRPAWRPVQTRQILRYSVPASASSIFYAAFRNIDYLLLAAFIPAFQVGLYMRAYALGSDYQDKISQVMLRVAFPVLSRARDLDQIRLMRARMIRVHSAVLFPLLFGLIAVAPEFVPWMYGERWAVAGHLTQILAVGGMLAAVGTGTGALLLAAGRPRALLGYNVVAFSAYTIAVLASLPFGLTAVCIAVVTVRLVVFVVLQRVVVERLVGIPVLETVRDDVIPALAGGLPQLAVTMLGVRVCLDASFPVLVAIALPGALGLSLYAVILRTLFPATWADLRMLGARVVNPSGGTARSRVAWLRERRTPTEGGIEQESQPPRP
jgi:lipopolysaccharide exporter